MNNRVYACQSNELPIILVMKSRMHRLIAKMHKNNNHIQAQTYNEMILVCLAEYVV